MEKQTILQEHNRARQMLALGKVAGQPAAMNMREMVWDEELARIAQRWADQCMPGHDHRRNMGQGCRSVLQIGISHVSYRQVCGRTERGDNLDIQEDASKKGFS